MATSTRPRGHEPMAAWLGVLLLLGVGGYLGWLWWHRPPETGGHGEVLAANNRGVGHMEQFKFPDGFEEFEEVARLAPDWLPGRINLAIAVMNVAKNPDGAPVGQRGRLRPGPGPVPRHSDGRTRTIRTPTSASASSSTSAAEPTTSARAIEHFRKVTEVDPHDAAAWYWLGISYLDDSDREERRSASAARWSWTRTSRPRASGVARRCSRQEGKPERGYAATWTPPGAPPGRLGKSDQPDVLHRPAATTPG